MQDLRDKVAVVTGAASGIGRAMADRFAREGMKIALVDIETEPLAAAERELRDGGTEARSYRVDVSNAEEMDALGRDVIDQLGGVHIVCNNAGVASGGPMWELSIADWEFTLGPNLWGVIHGVRVFGPHLVAQDEGHFVNTASMAGLVSASGLGPYNVSKHGVVTLSETLAGDLEAAGSQVGVSVLCPGFVQTQIWNSDRNRDPATRDASDELAEGIEQTKALMKAVIQSGVEAEKVADLVHDAVCSGRFYIFTHEGTPAAVEARAASIVGQDHAAQPAGGAAIFMK